MNQRVAFDPFSFQKLGRGEVWGHGIRGSADASPCAGRAHVRERVTVGVADAEALSGLVRAPRKHASVETLGSVRTAIERRDRLARGCSCRLMLAMTICAPSPIGSLVSRCSSYDRGDVLGRYRADRLKNKRTSESNQAWFGASSTS